MDWQISNWRVGTKLGISFLLMVFFSALLGLVAWLARGWKRPPSAARKSRASAPPLALVRSSVGDAAPSVSDSFASTSSADAIATGNWVSRS